MSIVTYENVDTPVFEIDFLRYLFANGAQGSLWGPLPYYSDAAGTVVAAWGDPVGNIPDASGNGNDWTQVTSTARPILGRVPVGGRRNLLTHTETFDTSTAGWVAQNITTQLVAAPDGSMTAVEAKQGTSTGIKRLRGFFDLDQLAAVRGRVWLKAGSISYSPVRIFGGASSTFSANVDLEEGTTTAGVLTDKGNGWFELDTGSVPLDGLVNRSFDFFVGGTGADAGDGSSSIIIWHPDLRLASLDGPYQRVGNEYDITEAGVKGIHYLRFDGTDDQVTTTLPAISGGTIVLAGTNGIWIDSLDFAGGEFSVGPDTYTGGPAGLMSVLGDLLVEGGFVIDRALTPEEIAKVKSYYLARGAPGWFVLGDELVVNGTFDSDTSSWTSLNNGALSVSSQRLSVQSDGTSGPGARQDVTGASGQALMLQTRLWRGTTNPLRAIEATVVHTGVTVNLVHTTDGALLRGVYVAPEASGWVRIRAASTSTAGEIFYADDVSLRPLTLVTP